MLSDVGMRPGILGENRGDGSFGEDLGKELGLLLREQRRQQVSERERELNLFRSGSAPPTVEGSLAAVGGLLGEGAVAAAAGGLAGSDEEIRKDPAYLSYYYSHVNLNPRLPPPALSKEDWRLTQRLQAASGGNSLLGGIGDRRKVNRQGGAEGDGPSRSLFSSQPGFNSPAEEGNQSSLARQPSAEWLECGGDGLFGLSGFGLGPRQKSFADILQFFEHGTSTQRRELAEKLTGHVLTLSLQMYGCRVIQKAIEVVDLDQQTRMVSELDGHVMRCVRDQNGNHVIQKCIECIPQDAIQFIISSFYDQVVTLSTHPYGCRVIQRVLEHCSDATTQRIMMDEILQSVCMLAQDQYGNYVVQHVLEHGKPHERSAIIKKLAGQIVQMSQQKFASNVVEKCLTFGGPAERQILVNEMLGSTDENEPLQAMMKDQFANYVVQKVLETCDDQQRELILSRIKVHLNALKKYTYGKHIVARVEKLVAAGERRIGVQASHSS